MANPLSGRAPFHPTRAALVALFFIFLVGITLGRGENTRTQVGVLKHNIGTRCVQGDDNACRKLLGRLLDVAKRPQREKIREIIRAVQGSGEVVGGSGGGGNPHGQPGGGASPPGQQKRQGGQPPAGDSQPPPPGRSLTVPPTCVEALGRAQCLPGLTVPIPGGVPPSSVGGAP